MNKNKDEALVIGVVCGETGLETLLDLMEKTDLFAHLPPMTVAAVTGDGQNCPSDLTRAKDSGMPVYPDFKQMFEKHPEINMVLDLTGREETQEKLRAAVRPGVSIVDRKTAGLLWKFLNIETNRLKCEVDLFHTREILNTLFDELDEDVLVLDLNGRIVDANLRVYQRLGLERGALVGRNCWDSLHKSQGICCPGGEDCPFYKTLVTRDKAEALQRRVDPDGRLVYNRVYTYPVFNSAGELTNVVEIRRDITQRTHMEKRLQQSEKLAVVGELSTYIAHEIRNPLFAIGGFANSLMRTPGLNPRALEKAKIILEESKRLDNILKSILNFARPTKAETGEVDINEVAAETMSLMSIGLDKVGIKPELDLASGLPRAKGDSELIKQCLINLIKNAVEAMPKGGVLTVKTSIGDQYVQVSISDTGPGIDQENRSHVFSPFFSTKNKGSGLGLAMTKKIVEDLGGEVGLESVEGVGTTVTLGFSPVLAVTDRGEEKLRKKTIVLATRNQGKIRELSALLSGAGLEVKGLDDFPLVGDIEETGTTFAENAMIKARAVSDATGLIAVADDSGLEVDALSGAPGVYSARYSGKDADDESNNKKLLEEMKDIPPDRRTARFRCVMTAYAPGGESLTVEGKWEGLIAEKPIGENGFGYDPVFVDRETGQTAAQMSTEHKNSKSHRGAALRALLASWPDFWEKARPKEQ